MLEGKLASCKASRNKTASKHSPQKNVKKLLFGRSVKSVTVKLSLLKCTNKNHS